MPPDSQRNAVRVGLLVLAAVVALAAGIFLIGEQNNLFSRKNEYKVRLESVTGLQGGNPVQLNGVDVGRVVDVRLPEDPAEHLLEVTIAVDARYRERIRGDSRARIKTLGLLGDKYIDLTSGTSDAPEIEDGGEIAAAEATDVDRLIASGEDVVENIVTISVSLKEILARMEAGEGLLGELMRPRQPDEPGLNETLRVVHDAIGGISDGIATGRGPLGRMIHDEALGERMAGAVTRLDAILASIETGDGLLPALLRDEGLKNRADGALANLESASARLDGIATRFDEADGLLPRLLEDEAFAEQIGQEIQQLLERLNRAAAKLESGDGTVARLLDDPSVYEAIQDVMVGVNESKLLRWLIRNRQKKGIRERYRDERALTDSGVQDDPG